MEIKVKLDKIGDLYHTESERNSRLRGELQGEKELIGKLKEAIAAKVKQIEEMNDLGSKLLDTDFRFRENQSEMLDTEDKILEQVQRLFQTIVEDSQNNVLLELSALKEQVCDVVPQLMETIRSLRAYSMNGLQKFRDILQNLRSRNDKMSEVISKLEKKPV